MFIELHVPLYLICPREAAMHVDRSCRQPQYKQVRQLKQLQKLQQQSQHVADESLAEPLITVDDVLETPAEQISALSTDIQPDLPPRIRLHEEKVGAASEAPEVEAEPALGEETIAQEPQPSDALPPSTAEVAKSLLADLLTRLQQAEQRSRKALEAVDTLKEQVRFVSSLTPIEP